MKVLIAYDGSSCADAAIEDLKSAGLPRQSEALVVCVAHNHWPHIDLEKTTETGPFGNPWKVRLQETEAIAGKARSRIQETFPAWTVRSEALWGDPAKILRNTMDHWQPDLLVMGSHGRSLPGRLLLGSVSLHLVHHAPCPVRLVRVPAEAARQSDGPIRILVADDGSAGAQGVVAAIARRAWPAGTEARVVSVVETLVPPIPALLPALEGNTFATEPAFQAIMDADDRQRTKLRQSAEASAEKLQKAGLSASATVLDGDPRHEILAEAERWKAGSLFVGARGLGALDRLMLGSVSSAVATHAHCSVEVVRSAD